MAFLLFFFFFFFLYHLLPNIAASKCPESIQCGDHFPLQFPFTDTNNPKCGLFPVQGCTDSGNPVIQLSQGSLSGYHILRNISTNKFKVLDSSLYHSLSQSQPRCFPFQNISLPKSPSISFSIPLNLTLYLCSNHTFDEHVQDYFENYISSYQNQDCEFPAPTVYYLPRETDVSAAKQSSIPAYCGVIQLPVNFSKGNAAQLFDILTAEFDLEWSVSEACYKCYHEGGQCLLNTMNDFHCAKDNRRWKVIIAICIPIAAVLLLLVAFFILWQRKKRLGRAYLLSRNLSSDPSSKSNIWGNHAKAKDGYEKDIELFLNNNGNLAPIRYKYSTIKKITNSFSEKLGRGGFGSVYKGQLPDGHPVAVKVLHESDGNGEDFMNEVASISRTSHINIVSLLGFCFEGSKRALIFDFMPNGSLEKFIGNTVESGLGWNKLFEIALGIARGLEYLHQGCNTRILHLDIKPQNILLDKDLNPRISDFGLAKLCPNRSSIVSMMVARGTIGYIAPEVFSRNFGEVSYKSDVYSYGMLVLEMVGGRRTVDRTEVDRTSEIYFPHYIYKDLEKDADRYGDFVGRMSDGESQIVKRNMMIVGLWCVQTNPKDRPSMTKVVEMLEGKLGTLEVPPKPYLYSPPRSAPTFSNSESF